MRVTRRVGRALKANAKEDLLQWRREGFDNCEEVIATRKGIVTPLSFRRGRGLPEHITLLTNPTFILINPARDMNDNLLDIAQGDLFVRLRYYQGLETTEADAFNAVHHVLTVHSFEEHFNGLRVLGDLQT